MQCCPPAPGCSPWLAVLHCRAQGADLLPTARITQGGGEMKDIPLSYTWLETPIGRLLLAGDDASLHFLSFPGGHKAFGPQPAWSRSDAPFGEVKAQLLAYFAHRLQTFDLPLTLHGTAFQKRVWGQLRMIPFGVTSTYGTLAARIGAPRASRAVGAANGANPLPIIIPCHRVIGATGALTGFGGGIETKKFLLAHEGSLPG